MTSPESQLPIFDLPEGLQRQLGVLLLNRGQQSISLPLASVDIAAKVIDRVAQVTVKQVFRNYLKEHLEAVYIFPLAPASAIFSFDMKVGERVIKGVVQERAEARRQYQAALDEGKRAALMEQERDDVFTVQVGNLPPGEEVTIEISYSERLPFFENGSSELRLPLVVGPRYIPGKALGRESVGDGIEEDTNLVPDASRISPPRLAQGVDPQTALKLRVEVLPADDSQLSDLSCSQHATKNAIGQGGLVVTLARVDEKLNRDFVLRWRSTSEKIKTSLITYKAPDGETYGLLSIMPPKRNGYLGAARDVVFVLDRSGSMQGIKMTSAVRACSILLDSLGRNDRFAIAAFDNSVEWMPSAAGTHFVNADSAGVEAGEKYLRTITARGGTEMDLALRNSIDALNNLSGKDGRLPSLVVLTDGEVGNESQILQRIQKEIGDARLFAVGIDTAVNSGLLKRLANLGGGTAAFVEPGIQLEEALTSIAREIGAPLVTDMQVENLDLTVDRASLSPTKIPDIFVGRASACFFKLSGKGKLLIKGKFADGKVFEERVKAQTVEMPAVAQLWAKAHIVDLEDQFRIYPGNKTNLKKQIVDIAVKHSLLTKFTAFVVVDESEIVNQTGTARKIVQPVEIPEAWEMGSQLLSAGRGSYAQAQTGVKLMRMRSLSAPSPVEANGRWDDAPTGASGYFVQAQSAPQSQPAHQAQSASQAPALGGGSGGSLFMGQSQSAFSPPAETAKSVPEQAPAIPTATPTPAIPRGADQDRSEGSLKSAKARKMKAANTNLPEGTTSANGVSALFESLGNYINSVGQSVGKNLKAGMHVAEVSRCKTILEKFFSELENAFLKLENGGLPDAMKLENARLALVQALAPTKLGMELPCLQRFLRATGIELVSSLKDKSVSLSDLQMFWKTKQEVFEEIKREVSDLLSGTEAAFWDSSI